MSSGHTDSFVHLHVHTEYSMLDGAARLTELFAGRERLFWDLLQHDFPTMAGAAASVRRLCDAGFAVGVATSGTREYIDHVLATLGVRELISATTCGDDVQQPKPDPECYLRTAAELGIAASLCVAVEDTELGARSAAAAGMHVLGLDRRGEGIPSAHQRFEDLPSLVDHLLPSRLRATQQLMHDQPPPQFRGQRQQRLRERAEHRRSDLLA